jgi:hypothetical protein
MAPLYTLQGKIKKNKFENDFLLYFFYQIDFNKEI